MIYIVISIWSVSICELFSNAAPSSSANLGCYCPYCSTTLVLCIHSKILIIPPAGTVLNLAVKSPWTNLTPFGASFKKKKNPRHTKKNADCQGFSRNDSPPKKTRPHRTAPCDFENRKSHRAVGLYTVKGLADYSIGHTKRWQHKELPCKACAWITAQGAVDRRASRCLKRCTLIPRRLTKTAPHMTALVVFLGRL